MPRQGGIGGPRGKSSTRSEQKHLRGGKRHTGHLRTSEPGSAAFAVFHLDERKGLQNATLRPFSVAHPCWCPESVEVQRRFSFVGSYPERALGLRAGVRQPLEQSRLASGRCRAQVDSATASQTPASIVRLPPCLCKAFGGLGCIVGAIAKGDSLTSIEAEAIFVRVPPRLVIALEDLDRTASAGAQGDRLTSIETKAAVVGMLIRYCIASNHLNGIASAAAQRGGLAASQSKPIIAGVSPRFFKALDCFVSERGMGIGSQCD